MKKVLVACLENWDTLQELPFVLSKGGCTVDVFCSKKSWLISNKYYNNWIESSDDLSTYVAQLSSLAENGTYDWVIPADEKLLNVLNDAIQSPELFYKILPLTKIENREILASKAGLSTFCENNGIASPRYIIYDHKKPFDTAGCNLNYPILLKQDLSWGGGGILYCEDEPSFRTNLQKTDKRYNTIIQEYITGNDIGVEALFHKGELVEYNTGEVTVYFDHKFNFTTKRNYFNNKRIGDELRNIGRKIGIHGFASIQFIYKPGDDTYYLLEVDIRPNIWVSSGRFTGHNFSDAVNRFLHPATIAGYDPYQAASKDKITEVALFYRDIIRCMKQKDIKGICTWVFNLKGYWRFIPTYDNLLFKRISKELFINKVNNKLTMLLGTKKQKKQKFAQPELGRSF